MAQPQNLEVPNSRALAQRLKDAGSENIFKYMNQEEHQCCET
jgi:hypothetical protein